MKSQTLVIDDNDLKLDGLLITDQKECGKHLDALSDLMKYADKVCGELSEKYKIEILWELKADNGCMRPVFTIDDGFNRPYYDETEMRRMLNLKAFW